MSADSMESTATELSEAFPEVDPGVRPLGGRVLVQLRRLANKTKSGIVLVEETKETAKWNNQVAKVVAVGPMAFKDRKTGDRWPEGAWVKVGDYVRVPRWNGDRTEVAVKDSDDPLVFVTFNDFELINLVTGDPLKQRVYVL